MPWTFPTGTASPAPLDGFGQHVLHSSVAGEMIPGIVTGSLSSLNQKSDWIRLWIYPGVLQHRKWQSKLHPRCLDMPSMFMRLAQPGQSRATLGDGVYEGLLSARKTTINHPGPRPLELNQELYLFSVYRVYRHTNGLVPEILRMIPTIPRDSTLEDPCANFFRIVAIHPCAPDTRKSAGKPKLQAQHAATAIRKSRQSVILILCRRSILAIRTEGYAFHPVSCGLCRRRISP
eukprot:s75_g11.t1